MYLMKGNLQISKPDIIQIQSTGEHLINIRKKISQNDENINSKFCLIIEVLFKKSLVFNEIVYRLCLPRYLGREILFKLHNKNHCHISDLNLQLQFNANFYTYKCAELVKTLAQSCLLCRLNQDRKTMATKGDYRHFKWILKLGDAGP